MRMVCLAAGLVLSLAARAETPVAARGVFVSHNYAVTFRAPPGLTYCRLPDGWTGSDHGTVLFLVPPASCGGTGYPSISRGFEPKAVPRIEIYYGFDQGEEARPVCGRAGHLYLLGRDRPLCSQGGRELPAVEVRAGYWADSKAELSLTLVTTRARFGRDVRVLQTLASSVRVCSIPWNDAAGRRRTTGWGRRCPTEGAFY